MITLRNLIAHFVWMRWPIHREMPRWSYRFSLWLSPWAVAWAHRAEPEARHSMNQKDGR